ncbi:MULTISPECIES: nuclear transport factor 2 family protein [Arthrobacter]|uniref:Nuclear transport factor 2 family protein n=1 Tax=Arthrobacter terricola TaxID=2547396 RepID=A0A4R5K8H2_9MICC|nr:MULTISPECIES: nuclear transport factor 2 family protein [Arthrobacter]MBT8163174.1 nuclear transport factor 2 family protein [Arthrobacter sp. GN70]TDF91256.1 nuclear transport factor 2 family protein [Arthrobacter terricola]
MTNKTVAGTLTALDRLEIQELTTGYGVHHDRRDFASLRECFTPDATYIMHITDGPTFGPHQGPVAIVGQIQAFKESQNDVRRHHISNIQIEPLGDDIASVLSYVLVSASDIDGLAIKTVGTYADTVVRTPAGWRIARKELQLDSTF